jgi:hypothetical protein
MKRWISRLTTASLTAAMVLSLAPGAVYAEGVNAAGMAASASSEQYAAAADSGETAEEAAFTAGSDEAAIEAGSGAAADEAAVEAGSEDAAPEASSEEAASEASSEEAADTAASVEKVTASSTQLAAPTVSWGGDYNDSSYEHETVTVTTVANCTEGYTVQLYKDGTLAYNTVFKATSSADTKFVVPVGAQINTTGKYQVRVQAKGNTEAGYQDSDWGESEEWDYTAPDKLQQPAPPTWEEGQTGKCSIFVPDSGAQGYLLELLRDGEVVGTSIGYTFWKNPEDFTGRMTKAGKYKLRVRALSGDLTKYANSDFSEFSAEVDFSTGSTSVREDIDAATAAVNAATDTSSAVSALKALTDKDSASKLKGAMLSESAVRNSLADLEAAYKSKMGITLDRTVNSDLSDVLTADTSRITILGAALNTTTEAAQLHLRLHKPDTDLSAGLPDIYYNAVPCSIDLEGISSYMSVPVYVTMPVPKGVNKDCLVILDYADGSTTSYTVIEPTLNADGTISFIMDSFGDCVFADKGTPFTDLGSSAWVNTAVSYVYGKGLMKGTSDTTFNPTGTLTRGMFAAILYRTAGSPSVTYTQKFSDVPSGKYYSLAVTWASNSGLISGYGDTGRFGPNNNITRAQIAKILYLYAKSKGYDLTADADLFRVRGCVKTERQLRRST